MTAWGAFGEKKNYGKVVQGTIRSTVVVGPDGAVEHAAYNVKATGHVAKLRRTSAWTEVARSYPRSAAPAGVAELVDAQDLGSCVLGRAGSSPASRTGRADAPARKHEAPRGWIPQRLVPFHVPSVPLRSPADRGSHRRHQHRVDEVHGGVGGLDAAADHVGVVDLQRVRLTGDLDGAALDGRLGTDDLLRGELAGHHVVGEDRASAWPASVFRLSSVAASISANASSTGANTVNSSPLRVSIKGELRSNQTSNFLYHSLTQIVIIYNAYLF